MNVKAIVYKAPGQVGLETFDLAPCADDEVLCETVYSFTHEADMHLRDQPGRYSAIAFRWGAGA